MKKTETKVVCAICKKDSMQNILLSTNAVGAKTHLDLRVIGGKQDLASRAQMCPYCSYASYNISRNIGITLQDLKTKEYMQVRYSDTNPVAKKFILSAMLLDKVNQTRNAGILYHLASWVFDDLNDTASADKYRKLACDRILKVALKEDDGDTIVQCIDLCRRNKNFQKAQELIKKVGTTGIAQIDDVLHYENLLISLKDTAPHFSNEANQKISFPILCKLLQQNTNFNNTETAIFAPLIYDLKQEYYDSIIKYLTSGEKTLLITKNGFSTEKIEHVYWSERINYVKAVLIINGLEIAGDNASLIYHS